MTRLPAPPKPSFFVAGTRGAGWGGLLLALFGTTSIAQTWDDEPAPRMGAFQCLICAQGGAVSGIGPSHGRARRDFEALEELCVSDYRYIEGELYLRFKLEDRLWPDDGRWTVQASSWEAVCHNPRSP